MIFNQALQALKALKALVLYIYLYEQTKLFDDWPLVFDKDFLICNIKL